MGEVSKLLGEPIAGQVAQQIGLRGIKAAALAARTERPPPNHDRGYAYVDFDAGPYKASGVRAVAFVPGAYEEEQDFLVHIGGVPTPFPQIGSYLQGKGAIDSGGVAFALDLFLDPTNLLSFGTAGAAAKLGKAGAKVGLTGLTETGRIARLFSAVTEGGQIRNGEQIVNQIAGIIEEAGYLANKSPELVKAAQAGDTKALKLIVKDALENKRGEYLGDVVKGQIEAMRRDAKPLGKFLEHLDDFKSRYGAGDVPEEFFLQGTVRGRIEAKQVNDFLSVVRPSNPLTHPLKFTRQMLGFHYANERFVLPMSRQGVEGLEKVGAGSLFEIEGAVKPFESIPKLRESIETLEARRPAILERLASAKEMQKSINQDVVTRHVNELEYLDSTIADAKRHLAERIKTGETGPGIFDRAEEAKDAFRAAGFTAGDLDSTNAVMSMHMARTLAGAPTDRLFSDVGYEAVNEATLEKAYRALNPGAPKDIPAEVMGQFRSEVLADLNGARRSVDGERIKYRDQVMDDLTSEFRRSISADPATQADEVGRLSAAQADVMVNQMRRAMDVFSIRSLQMDAFSPGNGLAARASFQGMLAKLSHDNTKAVIKGAYQGRLAREFISELPQAIRSHPDLWELRDGKYFLTGSAADIDKEGAEGAAFLKDLLGRSKASKHSAFLETHLRTEGLNPQVSNVVSEMNATYDMIGKNLLANEGVLRGLIRDYSTRAVSITAEGRKNLHFIASNADIGERLSEDAERQLDELMGEEIKVLADRANQGKVTFEEARKFTENQLLALEKKGWVKYEKDAVALFSGYLDAAGKSVLINRLWRDLPQTSGGLTRGALGKRAAEVSDDVLRKARRVMDSDPPRELLPFYKRLFVRPRVLGPGDDIAGLTESLLKDRQLLAAEETARKRLAQKWQGKKTVGGFRLRDKATGAPVPFQAEWAMTDSVPDALAEADNVMAAMRAEVAKSRVAIEGKLAKPVKEAAQEVETRGGVWVFEDDYNHLAEAFSIREKTSSKFWRKYDQYNAAFKSVVLLGDVFHFNVLAISQALLDPTSLLKNLYDDTGKLLPGAAEGGFNLANAAVKAGVGAAVGAGAGAVSGQDERGVATFSLVGALYGAVIGAAMNNARTGLRAAMNPANIDTLHWMGVGGWRGRPDDRSIGILNRGLKSLRDKLAREPENGALLSPIDGVRHVADAWDDLLWQTLHNGSKHHYFQVRWAKELPLLEARSAFKASTEAEQFALKSALAREIVQTSNNVFGGQTMRFLFDNPEFSHIARRFLLSPDWTASRLALASGFFMNMDPAKAALIGAGLGTGVQAVEAGGDPDHIFSWRGPVLGAGLGLALNKWAKGIGRRMVTPGDVMAKEARRVATSALLGGYVFANAVNYGLTGRWLFQNPEGRKTSIDIGGGNWVQLGKPWVEPFEFAGIYEPEKHRIPGISRLVSKGATIPVSALRLLSNQNGFGGPLILPDDSPFEIASKIVDVTIPLPIITSGPARLGMDALSGNATRQQIGAAAIRSAGFPVRGPGRGGQPMDIGALQRVIQSSAARFTRPSGALISSDPTSLERAFR